MGLIQKGSLVISIAPTSDAYTLKQAMWAGRVCSISANKELGCDDVTVQFPAAQGQSTGDVITGPMNGFALVYSKDHFIFNVGDVVRLQGKDSRVFSISTLSNPSSDYGDLTPLAKLVQLYPESNPSDQPIVLHVSQLLFSHEEKATTPLGLVAPTFDKGDSVNLTWPPPISGYGKKDSTCQIINYICTPSDVYYSVRLSTGEVVWNVPEHRMYVKKIDKATKKLFDPMDDEKAIPDIMSTDSDAPAPKKPIPKDPVKKAILKGMAFGADEIILKGTQAMSDITKEALLSPLYGASPKNGPQSENLVEMDDPMEPLITGAGDFEFYITKDPSHGWNTVSLYARIPKAGPSGGALVVLPFSVMEVPEGQITHPAATLTMNSAQNLMDELWNAGLRPKGFKEQEKAKYPEGMIVVSKGEMDALKNHLNDFRALVGKTLEVDL